MPTIVNRVLAGEGDVYDDANQDADYEPEDGPSSPPSERKRAKRGGGDRPKPRLPEFRSGPEFPENMGDDEVAKALREARETTISDRFQARCMQETMRYLEALHVDLPYRASNTPADPLGIFGMYTEAGLDAKVESFLILCSDTDLHESWKCVLKLYIRLDALWGRYFERSSALDANGIPMRSRLGGFGCPTMKALYLSLLDTFQTVLSLFQAAGVAFYMADQAMTKGGRKGRDIEIPYTTGLRVSPKDLGLGVSIMTKMEALPYFTVSGGKPTLSATPRILRSRIDNHGERLDVDELEAMRCWEPALPALKFAAVHGELASCVSLLAMVENKLADGTIQVSGREFSAKVQRAHARIYKTKASLGDLKRAYLDLLMHSVGRIQDAAAAFSALMAVEERYGSLVMPTMYDESSVVISPAKACKLADDVDLPVSVVHDMIKSMNCFKQCAPNIWGEFIVFLGRVFSKRTLDLIVEHEVLRKSRDFSLAAEIGTRQRSVEDIFRGFSRIISLPDMDVIPDEFCSEAGMAWLDAMHKLYLDKGRKSHLSNGTETLVYIKRATTVRNGRFTYPLMDYYHKQVETGDNGIVTTKFSCCYTAPSVYLQSVALALEMESCTVPGKCLMLEVMRQFMDMLPVIPFKATASASSGPIEMAMHTQRFRAAKTKVWDESIMPLFPSQNVSGGETGEGAGGAMETEDDDDEEEGAEAGGEEEEEEDGDEE